jgi:hypothetical protein
MTIQEIINEVRLLSITDQIQLVSQLMQLVGRTLTTSPATVKLLPETTTEETDFRKLSGILCRPKQPSVSVEAMNAAIEEEVGRLL